MCGWWWGGGEDGMGGVWEWVMRAECACVGKVVGWGGDWPAVYKGDSNLVF